MYVKRGLLILMAALCLAMCFGASAAGKKPVESIALEGPEQLYVGTSRKLTPTVLPKDAHDRRVRWSSSDQTVAVVSSDGTVRGRKDGTATVTCEARDNSGVTATFEIRVIEKVENVRLEKMNIKLLCGLPGADTERIGYTVSPKNAFYKGVTWSSSNERVVTVDSDGTLHAVAGGTAKITATTADPGSKAKATLTVTVGQPVGSIVIMNPPGAIDKGKSVRIQAEALPRSATDREILYSTSDANVFTVDKNGTVHAHATGKATLTCTARDGSGVKEQVDIRVIQMVTGLSAKNANPAVVTGWPQKVSVTVNPKDATDPTLVWTSTNPAVATVDGTGLVTGLRPGDCTIRCETVDGSGKAVNLPLTVEPVLPVKLVGFGPGVNGSERLVMRFQNLCRKLEIRSVRFEYTFSDAWGNKLDTGTAQVMIAIGPSAKESAVVSVYAPERTTQYAITVTGVTFANGSVYTVPEGNRVTGIWA